MKLNESGYLFVRKLRRLDVPTFETFYNMYMTAEDGRPRAGSLLVLESSRLPTVAMVGEVGRS